MRPSIAVMMLRPLRTLWQLFRIRHWLKNLLVFLPLLTSHRIGNARLGGIAALAFLTFSLAASGAYVINDAVDRKADREHPLRRERPLASRVVPLSLALGLASGLIVSALALTVWTLPRAFLSALAFYIAFSTAYSLVLKRVAFLDVLILAALYCSRIVAGGIATATYVSPWLLAFSMFFFLSLALVKRYTELQRQWAGSADGRSGRGYVPQDAEVLRIIGPVAGYLSALVLALYVNSAAAEALYRAPTLLWLVLPLLIYWVTRVWLLANRGSLDADPFIFATEDPVTYCVGALVVLVGLVATRGVML